MGYFVDVTKSGGDAVRAYRKIKRNQAKSNWADPSKIRQR